MVLLAFIGALFIRNDFITPIFLFSSRIFEVLKTYVIVKLSCYYLFDMYREGCGDIQVYLTWPIF